MHGAGKAWKRALLGYFFVLPSFFFLIVFTYYPIARSFGLSLFEEGRGNALRFVAFGNYAYMLGSGLFWQVMGNSLVYAVGSTVPSVLLGLLFALLLDRRLALRGAYRFSLFYPTMIPIAAASMVWVLLFSQSYGLVNRVLGILLLPSEIDWVNSSPYAMAAIIFVAIWKFTGYYMLLFLSGLQSIDESLYEEAVIEGATPWQKLAAVTLPLLSPTTFFVTLMAVINSLQAVDQIYVMTKGGPYNTTNVLLYYIYQNGFVFWDTGLATSASVVLFAVLLLITVVYYFGLQHFVHYEGSRS